ncbi:hypothetical protein BKA93DRAFT_826868 [Sparassis latifolia]
MSFISDERGGLARDLWPQGIGRPNGDSRTINDLQKWQLVPYESDSLYDWAQVIKKLDGDDLIRQHDLIHDAEPDLLMMNHVEQVEDNWMVAVQLQGFI